ncbi:MAG TPA: radical SAM protein, partial [Candidatus Methanoperedenaceae archaeon]|nr:radical SAM protein [Candidatus Methanoperedenaceae archaeon]
MDLARIKAELVSVGAIDMDRSLLPRFTVPTAGPGAGSTAIFFRFNHHRVRLMVEEGSPFRATLDERTGEIVIWKGTKELVRGKLEEELIHCPGRTSITMSEQCIY